MDALHTGFTVEGVPLEGLVPNLKRKFTMYFASTTVPCPVSSEGEEKI